MTMKRTVTVVCLLVLCAVGHPSGQQPPRGVPELPQGADAASNAFPVSAAVRVVRDIVYATYGDRQLKLDLYLPPQSGGASRIPGVIVVRGGAWRFGDKEAYSYIAGHLAKEGFVAASIEYRTSAEAKFPAAVHDVKAAVRWMRAHATSYSVDPNAIGAFGGSAGAHLVALLGTSGGVKELEGSGGNAQASSRVQAVVAMACVCNLNVGNEPTGAVSEFVGGPIEQHQDAVKAGSPVTYVSKQSPPLLLLHSQTDPVVPFAQSEEIERLYRRAGAPVLLKIIDAPKTHGFWLETRYFPETMRLAVEYLRENLKPASK